MYLKIQLVLGIKHIPSRIQHQSVTAVRGNNRCLFSQQNEKHICILSAERRFIIVENGGT